MEIKNSKPIPSVTGCLWNNLSQDLKSVDSSEQLKRGIKNASEISDSHTAIMYKNSYNEF